LEEVPLLHATLELLGREEVVVHAVLLARTPLARGCGHGKRELGEARQHELNKRALSCTRRPGDDEDRERMALSRRQASSVRRRRPALPAGRRRAAVHALRKGKDGRWEGNRRFSSQER